MRVVKVTLVLLSVYHMDVPTVFTAYQKRLANHVVKISAIINETGYGVDDEMDN